MQINVLEYVQIEHWSLFCNGFKTLGLEIPTTQMFRRRQNELQASFMKDEADVASHKMLYITRYIYKYTQVNLPWLLHHHASKVCL